MEENEAKLASWHIYMCANTTLVVHCLVFLSAKKYFKTFLDYLRLKDSGRKKTGLGMSIAWCQPNIVQY